VHPIAASFDDIVRLPRPDDSLLGGAIGAVTLIVVNELVARWEWRRGLGITAVDLSVELRRQGVGNPALG
jgi:hypothetical protein